MKKTIQFLLIFLLTLPAFSQTINTAKLDSFFTLLADKNKAWASVSIYKHGKPVYSKATGYSRVKGDEKTASGVNTKYRIGSITKMFTATMIFQLVDEGKLSLDTKLSAYFPKIVNADKIKISHLLNHHSGIHNFTNDSLYLTYYTKPNTQEQMLDRFYQLSSEFEPGTKGEYSNTGYCLLGYIIEKVTGNDYGTELKKRITSKIGLKDTYYGKATDVKMNEAFSYQFDGKDWVQEAETDMSVPHGAGAIVSTPNDLNAFLTALNTGKLISNASLEKMRTSEDDYGMGCFVFPFGIKTAHGHGGSIDAFESTAAFFPQDSMAIAVCTNGLNYSMNQLMIGLLSIIYMDKSYELPTFTEFTLNPESLTAYQGTYAAPGFPLKITIMPDGNQLSAQATGQPSFILEAQSETLFKFDAAAITIEFIKEENGSINSFKFTQGGFKTVFAKE